MQVMGRVACPKKFGSPNMSSSCKTKRMSATLGHSMSKSQDSFHTGLKPLSAGTKMGLLYLVGCNHVFWDILLVSQLSTVAATALAVMDRSSGSHSSLNTPTPCSKFHAENVCHALHCSPCSMMGFLWWNWLQSAVHGSHAPCR